MRSRGVDIVSQMRMERLRDASKEPVASVMGIVSRFIDPTPSISGMFRM